MMSQADLPISFWGYALETAAFTLNRVPTKSVEKAPYEMWIRKHPRLSLWDIRGKAKDSIFYNQAEGKVFVARNGVLLEKEFPSKGVSGSKVQLEEIWDVPEMVFSPH